jgi:hypothetical protein
MHPSSLAVTIQLMVAIYRDRGENVTQQQNYSVVGQNDGFELRRYPECIVASIDVVSSFERAGNTGFMALVSYITGNNHSRSKMAMTAPVIQQPGVGIVQEYPVLEQVEGNRHTISFVMPDGWTMETLPDPNDERVVLREVPVELVAVDRFSGRWSKASYRARLETLERRIKNAGYQIAGTPRFARFDPPWTPWFMRRNEIQIPVQATSP